MIDHPLDDLFAEADKAGQTLIARCRMLEAVLMARTTAKPRRQRRARLAPPDGLRTMAEAAAKLGCSIKTLKGHIDAGTIGYVALGHGAKRPRKMFTDGDIDKFIEAQTRKDFSPCPSSAIHARHSGASTSKSKVIAFSAVPRPRPGGKRKP